MTEQFLPGFAPPPLEQHQGGPASPVEPQPKSVKTGEQLKREGMAAAARSKEHELGVCREVAHDIAHGRLKHADGEKRADLLCNADDVAAWWERRNDAFEKQGGKRLPWIGNACGQLFKDGNWESLGYVKSVRPEAHSNPILQWRWKHGG
jgi:hypothetical protein